MAQINAKAGPFQKPGLILLVALLLVVVVFFIPHPVAASADEIQAVKEFLGQLSCHRSIAEHGSYALEGTYEFDMLYQSKPLHVVLGEDQFCYSGTGMFKEFNISNGSAAIDRLEYILAHS